MKKYEGKTEEEAVNKALTDLGIEDKKDLNYQVISVKSNMFGQTVTIGIYAINDVIVFADDYIKKCLKALGIEGSTEAKYEDGIIKLNIVTIRNKSVIGRNGDTLRSINELTRSACFNRFGGHYRILLNCDGYKENKYYKYSQLARKTANEVISTHVTAVLDPMTSDERRIIHQALTDYPNIKTQSIGTGHRRHITIQYIGSEQSTNSSTEEVIEESSYSENE